jgi:hypothetical protein
MERVEHDAACIEAGAVFLVLQTDTCDEGGEATGLFALELGVVAGLDVDSASFDRVMSCSPGRSSVSGTRRARGHRPASAPRPTCRPVVPYAAAFAFRARRASRYFLIFTLATSLCFAHTMPKTGAAGFLQPGTGQS